MKDLIIVSDFDGTVTKTDSLYNFFKVFAAKKWLEVEQLWIDKKIGSKECLIREFELVPNLCEKLIDDYTKNVELDLYFKNFINKLSKQNIDFVVVSDGVDYFINKILQNHNVEGVKVISNHAEFVEGKFTITFPNQYSLCERDSGTCKCKAVNDLRKNYKKIIYIGDGYSDFCVANKADYLFAKTSLFDYCEKNGITCNKYSTFKDIEKFIF